MKIFVNNTFYDTFRLSPDELVREGWLDVGFKEGGGFCISLVQSPLKYREEHPTQAKISIKEYLDNDLKFVQFVCTTDYGHDSLRFFIFPEHDTEEVLKLVTEFKIAIKKYRLDGSLSPELLEV